METSVYRYRKMPDHLFETVQYTRDNAHEVARWAPCSPASSPDAEDGELVIRCCDSRRRARYGTWITRALGTDSFGTCGAEVFDDYFEPADGGRS